MFKTISRALSVALVAAALHSAAPALAQTGNTESGSQKASSKTYTCPMCHERVSAAQAKKQHLMCACCKDKLVSSGTVAQAKSKK